MKKINSKSPKSTVRRCEVVSNLEDTEGNVLFDMHSLSKVLEAKQNCIKDYCYTIHDKCTYTEQDESKNADHKAGDLKPAHIHLLLRFHEKQPQHWDNIAKWFDLQPQFVSKINGRWEDAVLYQAHLNAPDKYQYSIDEITANFNVQMIIDRAQRRNQLTDILEKILSGEIREYNKTLEIDNIILVEQSRKINEAFKIRSQHLEATIKDRNMDVIFITGASGAGKTTMAKRIAESHNLGYFVSSGSNDPMDGYSQEPCLIVDDIRPGVMALSDFLKLLDNNTASSVKSRYKNKFLGNCELVILTTVLSLDNFYSNVFEHEQEPITQLKRRCKTYIRMTKDRMYVSVWDSNKMAYSDPVEYVNDICDQYIPDSEMQEKDIEDQIQQLIPFAEKVVPENQKNEFQYTESPFRLTRVSDANYNKLIHNK